MRPRPYRERRFVEVEDHRAADEGRRQLVGLRPRRAQDVAVAHQLVAALRGHRGRRREDVDAAARGRRVADGDGERREEGRSGEGRGSSARGIKSNSCVTKHVTLRDRDCDGEKRGKFRERDGILKRVVKK